MRCWFSSRYSDGALLECRLDQEVFPVGHCLTTRGGLSGKEGHQSPGDCAEERGKCVVEEVLAYGTDTGACQLTLRG